MMHVCLRLEFKSKVPKWGIVFVLSSLGKVGSVPFLAVYAVSGPPLEGVLSGPSL